MKKNSKYYVKYVGYVGETEEQTKKRLLKFRKAKRLRLNKIAE